MPARRLRPLRITLVVLAVHAIVGLGAFISQYEPLSQGGLSGTDGATYRDVPTIGDPAIHVLEYADGSEFEVHFDLFNEGPLPVTVTSVEVFPPAEEGYEFPLEQIEVRLNAPSRPHDEEGSVPFEPFRLSRGGLPRLVVVRARFDDCESHSDGGTFSGDTATVRFRVLGITREQQVPLTTRYAVEMPAKDCPGT